MFGPMRKLIPLTVVFAFAYAVLGPLGCGDSSMQSAPAIEHPFRPPTGSIYLLAGQDSEQLGAMPRAGFADGYLDRVPVRPSGISLYGGFPEPNASEGFDSLAWVQTANDYIALGTLDDTIFHFSINWVNEGQAIAGTDEVLAAEQAVLEGEHDAFIDWLADWCSAQRLPILLRLGYEFNRPVQVLFTEERYASAYRYIVDRMLARDVQGVAFVWASANLTFNPDGPPELWDFDAWYPGDDYADWFGFSMWFPDVPDTVMLDEARARDKPVLLAETTPLEFNVGERSYYPLFTTQGQMLDADAIWEAWWQPMFDFVEQNADIIGGWHYIANDWALDPLWGSNPLFQNSDARVWADDGILERWTEAASRSLFVKPVPGRFAR